MSELDDEGRVIGRPQQIILTELVDSGADEIVPPAIDSAPEE